MTGMMYGSDGVTSGLTNKGFCDRYGSDDVMSDFCDREDVWKCGVMSGFCDREDVWKCGVMSGLTNKGFCDRKDV